jgi:hypothetical protein
VFANSRTEISEFLLESIEGCTPLTEKFDAQVSAALRMKWSREVESMLNMLHALGIIWVGAKADNALVDENDDLCG